MGREAGFGAVVPKGSVVPPGALARAAGIFGSEGRALDGSGGGGGRLGFTLGGTGGGTGARETDGRTGTVERGADGRAAGGFGDDTGSGPATRGFSGRGGGGSVHPPSTSVNDRSGARGFPFAPVPPLEPPSPALPRSLMRSLPLRGYCSRLPQPGGYRLQATGSRLNTRDFRLRSFALAFAFLVPSS